MEYLMQMVGIILCILFTVMLVRNSVLRAYLVHWKNVYWRKK